MGLANEVIGVTPIYEWPLPTEVVVKEAKVVVPKMMRVWITNTWYVDGVVRDYKYLRSLADFSGTGAFPQRYIAETWEDWGDDGHISFKLTGYEEGTLQEIKSKYEEMIKWYW